MWRFIGAASLLVVVVVVAICLHAPSEPAAPGASPAFQALLGQAIAGLEGITQQVTAVSVPATHAGPQAATIDEYTCMGFRTCDALQTCDGTATCDGETTCWASTCQGAPTCETTCAQYTTDGSETCSGSATCEEGCPGWPTYFPGWETCTGGPTCEYTCLGFVSCSGCNAIERTTWGAIKAGFMN
jgi:hypothetical protein